MQVDMKVEMRITILYWESTGEVFEEEFVVFGSVEAITRLQAANHALWHMQHYPALN